eukprot:CAMPEP_0183308274 /NCGR_PEP_ID=MMETSP0160_2-20130417/20962_1 /TAXON_ID=2839 ORGANISM="Odontella Sinensis, Strain Grunow 1884" /NCGR_SAMPLE_ID=MMETSP0160_2 /ASSEMBLY_ACC=CAM_ASM_000250 /LENGTH=61 /DNA_ID=CAMNT_0025472075 /DNA_START=196 /DNA_END=377 /DNA_ORIENTATION=-
MSDGSIESSPGRRGHRVSRSIDFHGSLPRCVFDVSINADGEPTFTEYTTLLESEAPAGAGG